MIDKKKVYISFVKIGTPKGGDFYVTLKSEKIDYVGGVDFSKCKTKEEVLSEARKIDPEAKVIGGIILSRDEDIKIAGVYKPNNEGDIPMEEFIKYFDDEINIFKEKVLSKVLSEIIKRGV